MHPTPLHLACVTLLLAPFVPGAAQQPPADSPAVALEKRLAK